MPDTYVISDSHFNNENIISYCRRPFINSDHQTAEQIRRWNDVVEPDDTVIHCGDFIMGAADQVPIILPQLNGRIILVRGNHDTARKLAIYEQYPEKITVKDIHYLTYKQLWLCFCHFPICDEAFADMVCRDNSEVCWVHGHVHDKLPFFNAERHSFNVSADVVDFTPVNIEFMWKLCRDDFFEKGVWRGRE